MSRLLEMIRVIMASRRALIATARIDTEKKYVGSVFGMAWAVIYPVIFLSIYLFIYMVVFKMRMAGFGEVQYVLYVFSGLVPYLAIIDASNASSSAIKQNSHIITCAVLPVEIIPAKICLISMVPLLIGLVFVMLLCVASGSLSPWIFMLPVAIVIQILFIFGICCAVSVVGAVLPDTSQIVSLLLLAILFVTPIGFHPDMVDGVYSLVVYLNPVYYVLAPYRLAFLGPTAAPLSALAGAVAVSLGTFALGGLAFEVFKEYVADSE